MSDTPTHSFDPGFFELDALSSLDGRYAGKVAALRPFFPRGITAPQMRM
jgi:hypothetical protein